LSCSFTNESGQKTAPSRKDLSALRTSVYMEKEMGKSVGRGEVLQ
jgi:hypothetical protein